MRYGIGATLAALPSVPLNMLTAPEPAGIARVRLLVDFLADQIRTVPGIA